MRENVLEFSVEPPPGWQFWKENYYDVRSLKITATVENLDNREAIRTFFMSREEADPENIKDAYITYLVDCNFRESGRLSVHLNNNLLSSSVPDCGVPERTSIDPADFVEGRNELHFSAESGRYLFDRTLVKDNAESSGLPRLFL